MRKAITSKAISIFLAVLLAVTGILPATVAFAGNGGVEGKYDIRLFYDSTNTAVPEKDEDGSDHKEYMFEGDELQLNYKLMNAKFPNNGYVKWYSDAPALADVDQTGKIKAFDSSKGAVIHLWIDNEVKTIPIIGKPLGQIIEKAFFNEYVDLDSMDTDEIVALLEKTLGSNSWIADHIESYKGQLVDSLRTYLDKVNSDIHCELYNGNKELVGEAVIHIVVKKCEEWYAAFLPNGTHITNKSQVPTTVATGSKVQLYAITTPQRLNFGTVYSVKSSSVFEQGKVVATVDDSGLVKFKNPGTVTIMVSPDSEDVIEGLLKFINYFHKLEHTGTLDTQKVADILIKYIGIDINRNVLAAILDVCFAVKDIVGDAADPVQLTATAVKMIANLCLQFAYNDTIEFTVVKSQPLEAFEISGLTSVKEGQQIQLEPVNIVPTTGDISDIVWSSSDPSVACVDPETGIVTGLDAGGSLGSLSSKECVITALSTTNNVERKVTVKVTGKTGKYISKAEINGRSTVGIEETEDFTYSIYPSRVAQGDNLFVSWGFVTGTDEEGNKTYTWAEDGADAVDPDGIAKIDAKGHFTPLTGGKSTIACRARTGYQLSDGSFYEISSYIAVKTVETGIPVEKIQIGVNNALGNFATLGKNEKVNVNGVDYTYATVKTGMGNMYYGKGATIKAQVYPAEATDQNLKWVVDNGIYEQKVSSDTHSIDVTQTYGKEHTDTFNIYAVSADGEIKSNVITVCVTRNYANGNTINEEKIDMINGHTAEATHTMKFDGVLENSAYACYKANWYSSDEEVFTVENKGNDNSDAVLTAHDVGTATLYCVSADGAFLDSVEVTVRPDKQRLEELIDICEGTVVLKTDFNSSYYNTFVKKLDFAYIVNYEQEMASQNTVDTTAAELLAAFIRVGGFVGVTSLEMKGVNKTNLPSRYVTVKVGATKNYSKYSYDFDFTVNPKNAMYSRAVWTSSNDSIKVDENGVCTPTSNNPCSADITCTITDYNGNKVSDTRHIAFVKTAAEGVELNKTELTEAKIGESEKLEATVLPKNFINKSTASVTAVTWHSSNEKIASVDADGVVKFNYGGTAVITCTTADGGFTADCVVTVCTNYDKLQLLVNQYNNFESEGQLNQINYYPETWDVYQQAKSESEAMLAEKGYSQEQVDAQCEKLVAAYDGLKEFVSIQKTELYLDGEPTSEFYQYDLRLLKEGLSYTNAKLNLKVRLYPANAEYESVKWESSTTDISVTTEGVCSPTNKKKPCYGRITCTVTDAFGNEFSDDVYVSFSYNPVTEVRLSEDTISGAIGETKQLSATIYPVGSTGAHINKADIQDYYWESDDKNVATVSATGLVTFIGAGSTIVRCVSYDGGVCGECKVSAEGDRTALKAAIEKYQNVDYTDYEHNHGMEFKNAYDKAFEVLSDKSMTQAQIDAATARLNTAGEALEGNEYVHVSDIQIKYYTSKRGLDKTFDKKAGEGTVVQPTATVGENDAVSVNLNSDYSNYNDYNDTILTASYAPSNAMFEKVEWKVTENNNMQYKALGDKLIIAPNSKARTSTAYAKATAVYTDHYGKTTERAIWVTMSDTTCTGLTVEESELNILGSADPVQLHWSTTGQTGYLDKVEFFSSDEGVATVDGNGLVTVVNAGTCDIKVKTVDGGITKIVKVTVTTDYSKLEKKTTEYAKLIDDVKDKNQYTEESLNALSEQVEKCKTIIAEKKATQAEVNEALKMLIAAYNNLVGYIPATGVSLSLNDGQSTVKMINPGFVRFEGTSLNGAYVQLAYAVAPAGGMYDTVEWSSSNQSITVDNNGKVVSKSLLPSATVITVTVTTAYGDKYSDSVYVSFVRYGVSEVGFTTDLLYGGPTEVKKVPLDIKAKNKIDGASQAITAKPSIEDCIYESLDETVATVDGEGNVTFRSQGKTKIRVTSIDGGITAELDVQTTWDTGALQEAIARANALDYMDYEYDYGMQLKADREAAQKVYDNPNASQGEIDSACIKLTETLTVIEGHKFVAPTVTMTVGDELVTEGKSFAAPDGKIAVNVAVASDMYKTCLLSYENANGATVEINDKTFNITKTAERASLVVKATVTDAYDRVSEYRYTINIVDSVINATAVNILLDGKVVTTVTKSGYKAGGTRFEPGYSDFEPFTLTYELVPGAAANPTSVVWSSTASQYITVDQNGQINLTQRAKFRPNNTANIYCTVTNPDGTTVSGKVTVNINLNK
ncbi:Ig-like domain-containing protein [uncultured Eubacterium sp.]|uniref:Ig-like domain-containing protein n=1 Tax=uncultured Eubacterium sp. TaxID=165185 RepID=UPI002804363F|nr:Ig-like domain-containing protein [uncultured Eubacterium sp.]